MMANPNEKRTMHTMDKLSQSTIELMKGYVRTEKCQSQLLRIVSGTAWVTMDGEDMLLKPGDELKLAFCKHNALVSATGNEPLVYEFEE
jgi:hypothetical protein